MVRRRGGGTSGRVQWMERLLRPWYEQVLVQTVLPELDGLIESLNAGLGLRMWDVEAESL